MNDCGCMTVADRVARSGGRGYGPAPVNLRYSGHSA